MAGSSVHHDTNDAGGWSSVTGPSVHHDFKLGRLLGGAGGNAGRMDGSESFAPPPSAVLVEGHAWNVGIDGRPYYVVIAPPAGRSKTGRHRIKCGLGRRVALFWKASDGPLCHDGILRKMREWTLSHPDDSKLRPAGTAEAEAEEKKADEPDEPDAKPDEPDAGEI